jgi:hypothetical protein
MTDEQEEQEANSIWTQVDREGFEKGKKKYAEHCVRLNTKKHVVYPEACGRPFGFAYWRGVEVLMDEHKAMCRLGDRGNTIIFCGDPGSGKSTSVNTMVHGECGMQPDRSLTIRFSSLNQYATEALMIKRLKEMLHLEQEEEMSVGELADFVVDAVVVGKNEEKSVTALTSAKKSMWKAMQDISNGNWCSDTSNEGDGFKIWGLPPAEKCALGNKKPVIVLDDLKPFEPNGLLAYFLLGVAEQAVNNNVLVYMITNHKYAAYQIWQLNGGNKLTPLPRTIIRLKNPKPTSWSGWGQSESDLTPTQKENLKENNRAFRPGFAFHPKPFVFDTRAKQDLLWNSFRGTTDAADAQNLRIYIEHLVANNPDGNIDDLFKEMVRGGFEKAL